MMYNDDFLGQRLIIFAVILFIMAAIVPNYLRARASGNYTHCQSNLINIGTALEKYAEDNENNYPLTLSALTPKYLKTIPTCAGPRKNTYSLYYSTSKDRKRYTFFCQGINHREVGLTKENWPQYNSKDGLVSRP